MADIDERRDQYVPLDSQIAFKRTGEALLAKWGMEGLCAWMLLLAAAKREPVQGTFTFTSDAEAWSKIGACPAGFTLDEFLTFLGRRKQTSRRRHGRLTYLEITNWGRWNAIFKRRRDAAQKSRKRGESESDTDATVNGHVSDIKATEVESDSEREGEVVTAKAVTRKPPKQREPDPLWDTLAAELGEPATASERGKRNKALKELRDIDVTAGELVVRMGRYKRMWPGITMTATAIAAHWTELGNGAASTAKLGEAGYTPRSAAEKTEHERLRRQAANA